MNISINPKLRNALAESAAIGGIALAAIPEWSTAVHVPRWVGLAVALAVNVCNQLYKDSTPPPSVAAAAAAGNPAASLVSEIKSTN